MIRSDYWLKNRESVLAAKQKVMFDYNFFNVIEQIVKLKLKHEMSNNMSQTITIFPEANYQGGILKKFLHRFIKVGGDVY